MGLEYGLPIWAPVDGYGKFTSDVAIAGLEGKKVFDANPVIVDMLQSAGALLNRGGQAFEIRHSYPHCWRCKQPVIFRATEQWWIVLGGVVDLPRRGNTTSREVAVGAIAENGAAWGCG